MSRRVSHTVPNRSSARCETPTPAQMETIVAEKDDQQIIRRLHDADAMLSAPKTIDDERSGRAAEACHGAVLSAPKTIGEVARA